MATQEQFNQLKALLKKRKELQSSGGVNYEKLSSPQKTKFDAITNVRNELAEYRNLYDRYTGRAGRKIMGKEAAELRTRKAALEFAIAEAVGTGALQEADRAVVRDLLPDPTTIKGAAGIRIRGGKAGSLNAIDQAQKLFEERQRSLGGGGVSIAPLQLPPELQDYIASKRGGTPTSPGITPGITPQAPVAPKIAPVETFGAPPGASEAEKRAYRATAPFRFVSGIISEKAGTTIGEALSVPIARARIRKEFPGLSREQVREFVGKGPTGKEIAKDVGNIILTVAGPKVLQGLARLGKPIVGKFAQALEQTSLRLTPTQKANLGAKLKKITDYTSKLTGGPERRFAKAKADVDLDENKLQGFLKVTAKDRFVDKKALMRDLQKIKSNYVNDRDFLAIERQIDGAIETVKRMPSKISVDRLNQFKRSTYENAYSRAGDKVLDAVEFNIADVAKKSIEKAVKGLKLDGKDIALFNANYGTKLDALKYLKAATGKSQVGFIGQIVGTLAGASLGAGIGGPGGAAAGAVLGPAIAKRIGGTAVRSAVGRVLRKISQ